MPTNTTDIDWSKKEEVTDPAILAQLNASSKKPISDKVDEALSNNGLPIDKRELVLAQLRHETGKPNLDSHVAIANNNASGITWNDNFPDEWKGTARPDSEGGNYVHFPTYDDWAKEHIKLLKKDSGAGAPLDAGSIEDYAHRLKKNGYYKAPESEYVKGMKGMSDQYGREPEEVTDPAILAQLNGATTDPQKKSPSDAGLDTSLQNGQNGSSQNDGANAVDAYTHLPAVDAQAPVTQILPGPLPTQRAPIVKSGSDQQDWNAQPAATISEAPAQGVSAGVTGKVDEPAIPQTPVDETAKTTSAANTIAQDVIQNAPPSYGENMAKTTMTDQGNIVHDLTNPHADPTNTAQWGQHRIATLEQQRKDELAQAKQLELEGAPISEGKTPQQVNADYDTKVKAIKDAVDHTVALQQFNKEYTQKKYTPEEAQEQISTIATQGKEALDGIATDLKSTQKQIDYAEIGGMAVRIPQDQYSALLQKRKDLQIQQNTLQNQYNQQAQKIQNDTKYNPIQLGAEHAALAGDKQAHADLANLSAGKPINQDRQQAYNVKGTEIIKTGVANVSDENIKQEVGKYVDANGDQLFQNNKGYYINQLANARYNDENPLSALILPTAPWTKEDVRQYGNKIGLSENAIKELQKDPDQIPKSASEAQLFARGALNSYAPIKEVGARILGKLGGVPAGMVNVDYPAGWQNQRGPGAWVAGATPSDQNSFHNVRGAIGQVVEGVGGLAGLTSEVGGVTKALEEAGIGVDAASKLANMGVMSFNGYNDAYHNSLEVIGDKPEDETKRQAYSMVNGLLTGAIFSINPKANLLTKAFKVSDKVEAPLIEQIEKNNGVSFLTTPEGKNILDSYIVQAAKENGIQVGLAAAQKIAEDITNTIANPKQKQDIPEDVKNTAISTSLSMLIPSLIGASGREKNQTPYNAAAVWEMGTNPDVYTKHIERLKDAGKMTPQQAQASQEAIATMKNIVSNVPTTNDNGIELSPNQVKDYAFKMLQEHTLQQQVDQITDHATATGTKPDKVQIDNLNKKISDLQKERQKAYDNPIIPTPREQYLQTIEPPSSQETKEDIANEMAKEHYNLEKDKKGKLSEYDQEHNDYIKDNPEAHIDFKYNYYKELSTQEGYKKYGLKMFKKYQDIKSRFDAAKESNKGMNDERSVAPDAQSEIDAYVTKLKKEGKDLGEENLYKQHIYDIENNPKEALAHELDFYQKLLATEKAKDTPGEQEISKIQSHIDEAQGVADKINKEKEVQPEKKLGNTEKEKVTLTPNSEDNAVTTKTNDHEGHENGERQRQDGTEISTVEERGSETEVRNPAENGRVQGQEEGIRPTTAENKAGVSEQPTPAIPVSGKEKRKAMKLVAVQVEPELAAMNIGTEAGKPLDEVSKNIEQVSAQDKIGDGESVDDFAKRIKPAWDKIKKEGPNNTVHIAHSSVMRMIEAARKVGWKDPEKLKAEYDKQPEPESGEVRQYKGDDGQTIQVTRHAEREGKPDDLAATPNESITEDGKKEAKDVIAPALEKPALIVTAPEIRNKQTSDIISKEFSNEKPAQKKYNPPQPHKPLYELTGDELSSYHKELKQYIKEFEQGILGDNYKEFISKQKIADNPNGLHSREVEKAAEDRVKEIFNSLSKEDQDALDGVINGDIDKNKIYDPEDVSPIRSAVQIVEGAQSENELGRDLRRYFVDLNNAPDEFSKMTWRQKIAFAAMKAAQRIINERGWDGGKVTSVGLESASDLFPDKEDAEFMLSKYVNFFKPKENSSTQTKEQQQKSIQPGGKQEHARTEPAGSEAKTNETENSNSAVRSAKKAVKKETEFQRRKREATQNAERIANKKDEIRNSGNDFLKTIGISEEEYNRLNGSKNKKDVQKVAEITKKWQAHLSDKAENTPSTFLQKPLKIGHTTYDSGSKIFLIDSGKLLLVKDNEGVYHLENADSLSDDVISKLKEKLKETPQSNGAIATEDAESGKADATNLQLKEIEGKLQKEKALLQNHIAKGKIAEQKRQIAKSAKDAEATKNYTDEVNHRKDLVLKHQDEIEKLQQDHKELTRQQDEENDNAIKEVWQNKAANFAKTIDKNAEDRKGDKRMGPDLPWLEEHVHNFLRDAIKTSIEQVGNIHVGIRRAIRLTKEKFGDLAKALTYEHIDAIRDAGEKNYARYQDKNEPQLPVDHKDWANSLKEDLQNGEITYEEAKQEIDELELRNRNGEVESDHVQETNKAKILNYIDWHNREDATSIKNATTRIERAHLGLEEEMPAERKEFGDTWQEALDKIEDTKGAVTKNLIKELSKKARPVTDMENAILLHNQRTKLNELKETNKDIVAASDKGDQAAVNEAKTSKARILDDLQQIFDINKAIGTENARGLASRRMIVNEKYSLVNMIAEARATLNDGKPLTDEQQTRIEELNKKIEDKQKEFDDYIQQKEEELKAKEAERIKLQRQLLAERQQKGQANPSGGAGKSNPNASAIEKSYSKSKRVADKLRGWADKIEKSNKHPNDTRSGFIDTKTIADALRYVADGVEKGGELLDHIQKAITKIKADNPGIDEGHLESEINQAVIDAGIVPPSAENRDKIKATQAMTGFFKDGKFDRKAEKLNVAANRAKAEFDTELKIAEQEQLSKYGKRQNLFIRVQRAFKLSGPLTLGKLAAAALNRVVVSDPLEDIAGGVYSKLFPKLAAGAIGEGGGLHIKETADAMAKGWTLGMADAAQTLSKKSGGKSDLDMLMGKAGELPPEALDLMGRIHSMIKAPVKRYKFEQKLAKRLRRNIANGVDVNDPLVQTSILIGAMKDANRAIFMQDNAAADWFQKQMRSLEKVDPETGKAPNKWKATLAQWMIPFVKVPTNIVAEIARGAYGLPVGAGQVFHAYFIKGVENLSEEEKDIIFRNLKTGTIGAAAILLGYFQPQAFGGYYQPDDKRKDEDAEALGVKAGHTKLPAWAFESPIYQLMQIGATVRRVKDKMVHGEPKGIREGVWAGLIGLTENVPMVGQPMRILKALDPKERDYFVDELAKSTLDPALLTYIAKATDPADKGSTLHKIFDPQNKRKAPKTLKEHLESGLPILREHLKRKNSN